MMAQTQQMTNCLLTHQSGVRGGACKQGLTEAVAPRSPWGSRRPPAAGVRAQRSMHGEVFMDQACKWSFCHIPLVRAQAEGYN